MILHLSTQQTGGAAIAALRIHRALLGAGVDSRFLAGSGATDPALNIDVVPKVYERFWVRGLHNIGVSTTQYRKWQRTRAQNELPDTVLSGIRSDYRLGAHPLVNQAKVIHLHWVTGMFDWPDFFQQVKKPIVWTMHDMNPFMGVFHYDEDSERGSTRAQALDQVLQQQKARLIRRHKSLICVAPSHWLSDRAKDSEVLHGHEHHVIRNTLDIEVFRPFPREYGRDILGLPRDRKLLLVVAERLDNFRKGMDLFIKALAQCNLGSDWEVATVGTGNIEKDATKIHHLGTIDDARLLALLYSTADLFVIPSRQDNLPNTVLESLCCGTPVVGFPAGGILEAVHAPRDGLIAREISSSALAAAVIEASNTQFDRALIREHAVARFRGDKIAAEYIQVYEYVSRKFGN